MPNKHLHSALRNNLVEELELDTLDGISSDTDTGRGSTSQTDALELRFFQSDSRQRVKQLIRTDKRRQSKAGRAKGWVL